MNFIIHKIIKTKGNTIDEALVIIAKKHLCSKYFDFQKTDNQTINGTGKCKCSNCVDWCMYITEWSNH